MDYGEEISGERAKAITRTALPIITPRWSPVATRAPNRNKKNLDKSADGRTDAALCGRCALAIF